MLRLLSTRLLFGSAILLAASAPGARASDDVLEGWEKYKFGMTVEQVRAEPGVAWGEATTREFDTDKFTDMKATAPVKIGTGTYNLSVGFKPDKLVRIGFEDTITAAASVAACERRFTDALAELERQHGALTASSKQGKTDTPFGSLTVTWRKAPTGASTYNYLIGLMQFEPNGPVSRSIELTVIRKFGNKWLSLRAISPNDKTRCEITIGYVDMSS